VSDSERAGGRAIDFRPLTDPVDPRTAREFDRELHRELGHRKDREGLDAGCLILVVLPVGLVFAAAFGLGLAANPSAWWWGAASGVILLATAVLCVRAVRVAARRAKEMPTLRYRLARFAEANGLLFLLEEKDPEPAGSLIGRGHAGRLDHVLRWPDDGVEAGSYHYVTRSVKATTPWDHGYARVRDVGPAPELVLDATSARSRLDQLLGPGASGQETELVAPGGAGFTLRTRPRDTERAQAFVDDGLLGLLAQHPVNLEVVDGEAFLSLRADTTLPMTDPETWLWLLELAAALRERARSGERG